jgi:hypothetical protein
LKTDDRMDYKPLYEDLQHEFETYRKEKQRDDREYQVTTPLGPPLDVCHADVRYCHLVSLSLLRP